MIGIVILLTFLGLSSSFRVAENVVFEKRQEISVVRSNWMFSFYTDLKSYQGYLGRINMNIQRTETLLGNLIREFEQSDKSYYIPMFERQQIEIASLKSMYRTAKEDLRDILIIQRSRRTKRALMPFLGKALSYLTGTLTKKDLKKVYNHINTLSSNQEQIIHVLNDTLSILNVTNIEVQRNRHAIQNIVQLVHRVDERLVNFTGHLQNWLNDLNSFLLTYLQMDLMITELRESIEKAMFYMENVKMELDQLSLGHLAPTVIHPRELKQILTEIQTHIPKYLTLPTEIEDIWYYYKTLTCVTVIQDRKFITIVNLPLLELNSVFELYQVHSIPFPYPGTKMTATYTLESTNIAVNEKQTEYILLTAADLASCGNPSTKFCPLRSPLFELGESRLCVIALFKQDRTAISENCQTTVKLDTILPQAVYIPDGNWVIVSARPLLFTIICLEKATQQVQANPPVFHLQLTQACEAFADGITLPPFYHRESYYGKVTQRDTLLTLQNTTTFELWRPLDMFNNTDMTLLSDLPDMNEIDDIPLDTLRDKLNELKRPDQLLKPKSLWSQIWGLLEYILTFLLVLCMAILVIWLKFCRGNPGLKLCMQCVQAMESRKVDRANANQKADIMDIENVVMSTRSVEVQPMEVQRTLEAEAELSSCANAGGTIVLELAPKPGE